MIDRRALGAIVFNDPVARKSLESIVHPRMRRTFEKAIARVIRRGQARAVVLDAAILYEAGWNKLCDHVLYVEAPRELRLARLAAARGWDEVTLSARESAQWALVEKRGRAEFEVSNGSDQEALGPRVQRVWTSMLSAVPVKRRPASSAETETEPSSRPRVATRSGKSSGPRRRR
jgi:dephospho-CoA kinase